jgi:hypothetical protein
MFAHWDTLFICKRRIAAILTKSSLYRFIIQHSIKKTKEREERRRALLQLFLRPMFQRTTGGDAREKGEVATKATTSTFSPRRDRLLQNHSLMYTTFTAP